MYSDGISTRIYSDDGISTSFAPYALAYFTLASAFVAFDADADALAAGYFTAGVSTDAGTG